ncbi:MAG: response regulator transcription factor [Motiliproteus sp.]
MLQIAILEPQRELAESLMDWLRQAGHRYTCCSNLTEFMACISYGGYDLLLVDYRCGTRACFEQIEAGILDNGRRVPLLFISEANNEKEIVLALEHGADDYMVRPLKAEEVISRIQVLIRRFSVAEDSHSVQCFGPYCIDHEQLIITRDGVPLSLTGKDFSLAAFMFAHQNQLLSRHRLLSEVWGVNQEVNTRTVDMHISRLRKALMLPGTPFQIQTVHQHGYRLQCLEDSVE